jgi:hypothetical protein
LPPVLEVLEHRLLMSAATAPAIGAGNGLSAFYYNNMTLSGTPTVTEVDPTVNFDAPSGQDLPALPATQWSAKWEGQVQAQYSETYTFTTVSDDGVRLYVNGQEIINDWGVHAPTTDAGSITLVAGQRYNIEMDYFQDLGGAEAQLYWSGPSTPQEIIPQSQLSSLVATSTAPAVVGSGGGLSGSYYNNMTLSGTPTVTEVDPTVNFDAPSGQDLPALPATQWSAQWVGQVEAQ